MNRLSLIIIPILLAGICASSQPWKNLSDSADYFIQVGQYAKAEPFYLEGKKMIEEIKGKQSAEYASNCNSLGWLYRLTGKYQQSEDLLIEAKNIREKVFGKDNADYATSCNRLAVLYADVGQYNDAKPLYEEAMNIRAKVLGKEHVDYAMSCNNMGIYYMLTGNPSAAEPLHLEATRIREKVLGKQNAIYAASCNNLGVLYLDLGQYNRSIEYHLLAKQIRGEVLGKQHPEYAASCDNLAVVYMDIGRSEEAEALYLEGMGIRERTLGRTHPDYARSVNNLGLLYRNLGQYEKAKSLFSEARNILGTSLGKEHPEYAKSCNNLGALLMDMGEYDQAGMLYEEARKIWAKVLGKEHPEYAKSCNNLALMHYFKGEYPEAAQYFEETNQIREKVLGSDNVDYAASCDNLAVVYTDMGEYEKAIPIHTKALEIRKKVLGTGHADYLQSCVNNANLYWNLGDFKKAGELYREALRSQTEQTEKVFRFTTEPEKQSFLKKTNDFKNYFLSYSMTPKAIATGSYAYSVVLANRNLTLASSSQLREAINNTNDSVLSGIYNNWMNTREQLAFWYAKPLNERNEKMKLLEGQANSLEKELTRLSVQFRNQQQQKDWNQIRAALGSNEAAVEFGAYRYYNGKEWTDSNFYVAIILRKDQPQPELVKLFEQRELDAVLNYKSTSAGQLKINYLYANRSQTNDLYDLIWKPIESRFQNIKTIYFAPAGSLYKISFSALPLSNGEVLSDKFQLVQLNSTVSLVSEKNYLVSKADNIVLYGGVKYDVDSLAMLRAARLKKEYDVASRSLPPELLRDGVREFNYLDGAEKEIASIRELAEQRSFTSSFYTGVSATEESFKNLNGKNSPSIIHIATHGFFFPDPKNEIKDERGTGYTVFRQSDNPLIRSGLALAGANNAWKGKPVNGVEDGILTSYEVSNIYFPNTRLAVLSACETGLGDIQGTEGVYGLQRAFKMAGVEQLIMSLWKVPDTETAEFMQAFYKNIFSQKTIPEAFYSAQQIMKNKYRKEPYKWAAWVLVR